MVEVFQEQHFERENTEFLFTLLDHRLANGLHPLCPVLQFAIFKFPFNPLDFILKIADHILEFPAFLSVLFNFFLFLFSHRLICLNAIFQIIHSILQRLYVGKTLFDLLILQKHLLMDFVVMALQIFQSAHIARDFVQLSTCSCGYLLFFNELPSQGCDFFIHFFFLLFEGIDLLSYLLKLLIMFLIDRAFLALELFFFGSNLFLQIAGAFDDNPFNLSSHSVEFLLIVLLLFHFVLVLLQHLLLVDINILL